MTRSEIRKEAKILASALLIADTDEMHYEKHMTSTEEEWKAIKDEIRKIAKNLAGGAE